MIEVLRSNSLEVRPFKLEDSSAIYVLSQEKSLREWIPNQVYESNDEASKVLKYLISQYTKSIDTTKNPLILAVVLKESNKVIGHVGLSPHKKDGPEVGYAIGEKYVGRGYAAEAVSLLSDWAILKFDLTKIYGVVASENVGSYRVLEKSGFKKIEEIEMKYLGSLRDCKVYAKLGNGS